MNIINIIWSKTKSNNKNIIKNKYNIIYIIPKIWINYKIKIFHLKNRATAALFFSNLEMCFKTS